jgi:hypothetical protein
MLIPSNDCSYSCAVLEDVCRNVRAKQASGLISKLGNIITEHPSVNYG